MEHSFSILYLDDEQDNLVSFKAVFRRFYHIYLAKNAAEAHAILANTAIDLVISDQRMPDQTGVEFLAHIHEQYPHIMRMVLTGYSDLQVMIDAINKGKIYYFITKPWKFEELKVILDNALATALLKKQNKALEMEKKELLLRALQQEKAQLTSQYEGLKNQINPHFLFNSLNTLTSLIAENPTLAIKFTTQFAKMYRQLLELGEQALIPLSKELELIDTYLFLQKIRFGENISLQKKIHDNRFSLPPFALQLLVENALKHNLISDEKPLLIVIEQKEATLSISNKINPRPFQIFSTGIGLKNLNNRYQLLTNQSIICAEIAGEFCVTIPLVADA